MTMSRCVVFSVMLTVGSIGLCLANLFMYKIVDYGPPFGEDCVYRVDMFEFGTKVWVKMTMVLGSILPAGILLLCNIIIIT